MGYFDETDRINEEHGGKSPDCPSCGNTMYAIDDHGRYGCSSCNENRDMLTGSLLDRPKIRKKIDTK